MIDFNAALDISPHDAPAGEPLPEQSGPAGVLPLQTRKPMDIGAVKAALAKYDDDLKEWKQKADDLEVNSDDSVVTATESAGQAKRLAKDIEDARKRFIADPDTFVRSVNALAKRYKDGLASIENTLKRKIGDYRYKQEIERRKAAEEARKAQADLQARIDAEAKKAGVESVRVGPVAMPKRTTAIRTADGTAYGSTTWDFEVTDAQAVPRQYLMVDEKAIRQAVKAGVREIPGVNIFEKTDVRIRA